VNYGSCLRNTSLENDSSPSIRWTHRFQGEPSPFNQGVGKKQGQLTRVGAQSDNYFSPIRLANLTPASSKSTTKSRGLRAIDAAWYYVASLGRSIYQLGRGVNVVNNMTPYTLEIFVCLEWDTHTRKPNLFAGLTRKRYPQGSRSGIWGATRRVAAFSA